MVIMAILLVSGAFIGNMRINIDSFYTFIYYLSPAIVVILVMLNRGFFIKILIVILEHFYKYLRRFVILSNLYLQKLQKNINSQEFVFFTKVDNVAILNIVMQYVQNNETTKKLKIVNVKTEEETNELLKKDLEVLDRAYPEMDIEFIEIIASFGPELIDELSKKWNIPKNFMFIGSPGDRFPYKVSELGGVRLIM